MLIGIPVYYLTKARSNIFVFLFLDLKKKNNNSFLEICNQISFTGTDLFNVDAVILFDSAKKFF
jgi:hypothetical protein